ncbi:hypothetical protein COB57_04595 [Candidatus Peregrinibacteria bacterium]|nr:MAG: hypothetical protein COB57_04595 [Candidatus Peregrinibacteria bacterium]
MKISFYIIIMMITSDKDNKKDVSVFACRGLPLANPNHRWRRSPLPQPGFKFLNPQGRGFWQKPWLLIQGIK